LCSDYVYHTFIRFVITVSVDTARVSGGMIIILEFTYLEDVFRKYCANVERRKIL